MENVELGSLFYAMISTQIPVILIQKCDECEAKKKLGLSHLRWFDAGVSGGH